LTRTRSPFANPRWLLAGGLIVCVYVWHVWSVHYLADDGYIAFKYVDNLVRGDGLVFNPGERVEGYNDFLWLILLAASKWLLPGVELVTIAGVLGTLFGVLTIAAAIQFSREVQEDAWPWGLVAGALIAAHPGLTAWATSGLETTMFAFVLFIAAASYARWLRTGRGLVTSTVLFSLAALTRPEGGMLFVVTLAHLALTERVRTGMWLGRRVWISASVFALIFVPYFVWRYGYYGFLFPNTAYAKVGATIDQFRRGAADLRSYLLGTGSAVLLIPVAFAVWRRMRQDWVSYFGLLIAVHWTYIIYVGGDGLAFFRFFAYSAPIFYLLAEQGLADGYRLMRERWAARPAWQFGLPTTAIVAALLALTMQSSVTALVAPERARWYEPQSELSFPGTGADHSYLWFDNYFVDRLAVAARWLEANTSPGAVIAATPAGSIAFHMHRTVIDMLGLNDVHIAHNGGTFMDPGKGRAGHEKGDGRYVLSRSPDYILMGNVAVLPFPITPDRMARKLVLKSEHDIWNEPSFHRDYELVTVRLADSGVFQYFTFYRRKGIAVPPVADVQGAQP